MSNLEKEPAIIVNDVWKIFGEQSEQAYKAIKKHQYTKAEVLSEYECVVGVAGASFEIYEGEIFCIMGLSGSGKSTLVRHINRLLEPTAGEIIVGGEQVTELNHEELRHLRNQQVAMVFQNFGLMPHRTVVDNVAMPLEIRGASKKQRWEEAMQALALVNLNGWEHKYAHELSGGMQQRVGLARALATNPSILLMDEPFSALDPLIRRQLQDQFMALSEKLKKTTIFITHDLDEAIRIGNRIAIMKDGQIVQIGTPEEIVINPADDYVANFVAGISKLNLVKAHSIMKPIADVDQGTISPTAKRVDAEDDLNQLIDSSIECNDALVVVDNGVEVGVIQTIDLMRAIQGNRKEEG